MLICQTKHLWIAFPVLERQKITVHQHLRALPVQSFHGLRRIWKVLTSRAPFSKQKISKAPSWQKPWCLQMFCRSSANVKMWYLAQCFRNVSRGWCFFNVWHLEMTCFFPQKELQSQWKVCLSWNINPVKFVRSQVIYHPHSPQHIFSLRQASEATKESIPCPWALESASPMSLFCSTENVVLSFPIFCIYRIFTRPRLGIDLSIICWYTILLSYINEAISYIWLYTDVY